MKEKDYFEMRKEFEENFIGPWREDKFVLAMLDFVFKHGNDKLDRDYEKCMYSLYMWDKSIINVQIVLPNIFKDDAEPSLIKDTILKLNKIVKKYSKINMPRCIVVSGHTDKGFKNLFILDHSKQTEFSLITLDGEIGVNKYLENRGLYEDQALEDRKGSYYILTEDHPMFTETEDKTEEKEAEKEEKVVPKYSSIKSIFDRTGMFDRENDVTNTRVKAVESLLATYDHRLEDPNITTLEKQELRLKREFLDEFKGVIIGNSFRYTNEFRFVIGYVDHINEYTEYALGSDRLPNIFSSLDSLDTLKYHLIRFIDGVCGMYTKPVKIVLYMRIGTVKNVSISDLRYNREAEFEWKEMLYTRYQDYEWIEHLSHKNGALTK